MPRKLKQKRDEDTLYNIVSRYIRSNKVKREIVPTVLSERKAQYMRNWNKLVDRVLSELERNDDIYMIPSSDIRDRVDFILGI